MPPRVPSGRPSMCSRCESPDGADVPDHRRLHRAVAHRPATDLQRGRYVTLDQRGRHAQHVGDVVEAFGRVIRRQQGCDVDLQVEDVTDRVGVLRSVQSVQRLGAGEGSNVAGTVQTGRELTGEGVEHRALRPRLSGGWHHARAHFADGLFPGLGVAGEICRVQHVERDAARPVRRVVALGAVLVEQIPVFGWGNGRAPSVGGFDRAGCSEPHSRADQRRTGGDDRLEDDTHSAEAPSARIDGLTPIRISLFTEGGCYCGSLKQLE